MLPAVRPARCRRGATSSTWITTHPASPSTSSSACRYGPVVAFGGFRCDVASLVALTFWTQARQALGPDVWWLSESPHPSWVTRRREIGLPTDADSEMFAAFDMADQYDV